MKIEMIEAQTPFVAVCAVSKEIISVSGPYCFKVVSGRHKGKYVCEDVAIKKGFTISKQTLQGIQDDYFPARAWMEMYN